MMGRKVHPLGFRIGVIRDWQAKWYADKHYPEFIQEDVKVRNAIRSKYTEAGVSLVEIERQANRVMITIHTSRPGIVIGRGGQRVDETRHYLEELIDKKIQLNIQEIRQPELDAYLVARIVAEQIERRIAYRRAMKQALYRTMQAGAKGMRITCSGRLGGVEIARRQMMHQGRVPLHTLRADIDYGVTEAHTTLGRIGIKVWIYRGDILPEVEETIKEVEVGPAVEIDTETEIVTKETEKPIVGKAVQETEITLVTIKEKEAKTKVKRATRKKPVTKEEKQIEEKATEEVEKVSVVEKETKVKPKAKKAAKKKPIVKEEGKLQERVSKKQEATPAIEKEIKIRAKKAITAKKNDTEKTKKKVINGKKEKTTSVSEVVKTKDVKADAATKTGKIQKES